MVKTTKKGSILTLLEIKRKALPILKKNGVVKAGIFGSYARGEMKQKSDIDMLIKVSGKKSLLDIVGIQLDLQETLKKKVDLVEYQEIHRALKKQILNEEVKIL